MKRRRSSESEKSVKKVKKVVRQISSEEKFDQNDRKEK